MRRIHWLPLLLLLLAFPVRADVPKRYAALVVDSCADPERTGQLLDELYDRGIHATFLFQGSQLASQSALRDRIPGEGHQFGCRGYSGKNMTDLSRREIAAELMDFQALLPKDYPLRLFCPPGGVSDGVRQVAQVRQLGILSWSADADTPPDQIRDGDLIRIRDASPADLEKALLLADSLQERNYELVTVSRLAKLRQTPIRPGVIYGRFPPVRKPEAPSE